jgi:hypothetical protein
MKTTQELIAELTREGWRVTVTFVADKSGPPETWPGAPKVFAVFVSKSHSERVIGGHARGVELAQTIAEAGQAGRLDEIKADAEFKEAGRRVERGRKPEDVGG